MLFPPCHTSIGARLPSAPQFAVYIGVLIGTTIYYRTIETVETKFSNIQEKGYQCISEGTATGKKVGGVELLRDGAIYMRCIPVASSCLLAASGMHYLCEFQAQCD